MMNHDVNLNMIHRCLAGEGTAEEEQKVRRWMEADPAHRQAVDALRRIWEVQPRKELESDMQSAWQRLEEQLEQREQAAPVAYKSIQKKQSYHRLLSKTRPAYASLWLRVAAVVAVGFLLSLFFIEFRGGELAKQTEVAMREVVTKRAHQAQLTFSDGTRVILNVASSIRFPERFDNDVREVYLEGEAYFEVAHKDGIAFIVRTKNARIKVLGTRFNVNARPEAQEVEVAVADGKVAVKTNADVPANADPEVILTRGQMSTVKAGQAPAPPRRIEISNYLTWLSGGFVFDEEPFPEVLQEWERRYNVDFVVKDSSLLQVVFTGEFRNASLEEMLRLTSESLEFKYHRNGQTITINK